MGKFVTVFMAVGSLIAGVSVADEPVAGHEATAASQASAAAQVASASPAPPATPAPAPAPAGGAQGGVTAAAATSAAPSSAAAGSPAAQPNAVSPALDKSLRSQGYKPKTHDGNTVYCRKETQLGSRFEHEVCASPEQLDAASKSGKDWVHDLQRNSLATPPSH